MEMKNWAKTFLGAYRCLETISNAIDDLVKKESINSGFYNSSTNTLEQFNKISKLTERKIKIINIKVLVEYALANLKNSETRLLTLFYIDEVKSKDIALKLGISNRTFFRKKNEALSHFSTKLIEKGYNLNKILELVDGENWLQVAYKQNLQKDSDDLFNLQRLKLINYAIKEIKKNKFAYL